MSDLPDEHRPSSRPGQSAGTLAHSRHTLLKEVVDAFAEGVSKMPGAFPRAASDGFSPFRIPSPVPDDSHSGDDPLRATYDAKTDRWLVTVTGERHPFPYVGSTADRLRKVRAESDTRLVSSEVSESRPWALAPGTTPTTEGGEGGKPRASADSGAAAVQASLAEAWDNVRKSLIAAQLNRLANETSCLHCRYSSGPAGHTETSKRLSEVLNATREGQTSQMSPPSKAEPSVVADEETPSARPSLEEVLSIAAEELDEEPEYDIVEDDPEDDDEHSEVDGSDDETVHVRAKSDQNKDGGDGRSVIDQELRRSH